MSKKRVLESENFVNEKKQKVGNDDELEFEKDDGNWVFELPFYDFVDLSQENDDFDTTENIENVKIKIEKDESQFGSGSEINTPQLNFEIISEFETNYDKLRRKVKTAKVRVVHNFANKKANIVDAVKSVDNAYEKLFEKLFENIERNKIVSAYIKHSNLNYDIYVHHRKVSSFHVENVLEALANVVQSNDSILLDGMFDVEINITDNTSGGANRKHSVHTPTEHAAIKTSIVEIRELPSNLLKEYPEAENLCLARAIIVGKTFADVYGDYRRKRVRSKAEENLYRNLTRQDRIKNQVVAAIDLCSKANIPIGKSEPLDITDVHAFQKYLSDYQIVVIDGHDSERLYNGSESEKQIYLHYVKNIDVNFGHFDAIVNIRGFMGGKEYCCACHKAYDKIIGHSCSKTCSQCFSTECKIEKDCDELINCDSCNRRFFGKHCFELHKPKVCKSLKICKICTCEITEPNHKCNVHRCVSCYKEYSEEKHHCFISPIKMEDVLKKDSVKKIFVFFDIESSQRIISAESLDAKKTVKYHKPNLLVSLTVCDQCWNTESLTKKEENCFHCGPGLKIFESHLCVHNFLEYVVQLAKERPKSQLRLFAHNGKGYDFQFIIERTFAKGLTPSATMTGCKLLKVDIGKNINFIDTLSFFMQPLSALPKSFGIQACVLKGYFPHSFNDSKNTDYVGAIPDKSFFGYELMKPEEISAFDEWYDSRKHSEYSFKSELRKYCINDVEILAKSTMVFRKSIISLTKIQPFTDCFTLAMLNMKINRVHFIKQNTIGITPTKGYAPGGTYSKIGMAWLDLQESKLGMKMEREVKIGPYTVDGFCKENQTVYEFFGCYWHGCPHHTKKEGLNNTSNQPFARLFLQTEERQNVFQNMNYSFCRIWECQLKEEMKANKDVRIFVEKRMKHYEKLLKVGRLQPRDALFGGRTENFRLFRETDENEKIHYLDVSGLYPDVMVKCEYPIGHPIVITSDFENINNYFGIIHCKILPPRYLYVPVLPAKINHKLVFTLCKTCAENESFSACECNDEERCLTGTWITEEVKEAVKDGYQILEIYEINHWPEKSTDVFKDQINNYLKEKHEASGFPDKSYIGDLEKQKQYVTNFLKHTGIELDSEKIKDNAGRRTIAKIGVNNQWGKLGQRPNLSKTEFIDSYEKFISYVLDDNIEIKGDRMITERFLAITWNKKDDLNSNPGPTSSAIAAFVTAHARIRLLNIIREIESIRVGRILYCDTDSVIFVSQSSDPEISNQGIFCGQLTNEVTKEYGDGAYITKFVSGGPKNYGFEVKKPNGEVKSKLKIKGISLHCAALESINLNVLETLVKNKLGGGDDSVSVDQMQIRTDNNFQLKTILFKKLYKIVSTKRLITLDNTFPFGYKL